MADWYLAIDGVQSGPFSEEKLAADLRAGRIGPDAYVFGEAMADWAPVSEVAQLARHLPSAAPAPAPAAPPKQAAPVPQVAAAPVVAAAPAAQAPAPRAGGEPTHSIQEFLSSTAERDNPGDVFELESRSMLEVHVDGRVWSKLGAMVAYRGNLKFVREGAFEHGLGRFVKKMVTGEAAPLVKIEGRGVCYLADQRKHITILRLDGREALSVNGNDLLAFEDTVAYDITMHRRVAGMLAGGLFSVRLSGQGMVAIMSHGIPLTLRCSASDPVITDPNATVAWSGNLSPTFKTDISLRTFLGRGGGEAFQMLFQGDGFVVVQPFEEVPAVAQSNG